MRARRIGAPVVAGHRREAVRRALPSDGLPRRIDGRLLRDPVRHRPSDDFAMPRVHHGREVEPAPVGADIGDVADPEPVPGVHVEDAADGVRARIALPDRPRSPVPSRRALSPEARPAHDGQDALPARDRPVAPGLAVDAAAAVPALVRPEPLDDEPLERLPPCLRVRLEPVQAVAVLGSGDAGDLACLPDGAEFAPMRLDEPAPRAWS